MTTDRKKAQEAQWVAFNPGPGAITINIGDSLQYWSDGALKSTYHRVRCPTAEDYAVSLFSSCLLYSVCQCVRNCIFCTHVCANSSAEAFTAVETHPDLI